MKTILLVIALVAKADAPKTDLPTTAAASAAVAVVPVAPPVALDSAAVPDVAVVGEVAPMNAAVPPEGGILPAAASAAGCALVDLFKGDFLTGPWGAAWRLEAAKRRGDEEAVRRLEATLDALITEAVGGE